MTSTKQSRYRRPLFIFIILLSLFLFGTVVVLSSVTWFFGVPNWALLSERDVPYAPGEVWMGLDTSNDGNASWARQDWDGSIEDTEDWAHLEDIEALEGERIPRIIHQTWINDVLPEKWRDVYQECRRGLPDYTYHLWTDSASRAFISTHYPSFLPTFDSYPYPIQRADAIRYFVLHHFGGIYMDLDVGCKRDLGPLLKGDWDVVLAKTIPVGVSNDIMLSSKRSAFMEMTIHGLITFNHDYVTNYPTVMFSTGPMFLSAQYSIYTSSHPLTPVSPTLEIRVMPKSLYGKNASPEEAPHAFFSHFYGSSWHADDSDFIIFLGRRGKWLMRFGALIVTLGAIRLIWMRGRGAVRKSGGGLRRLVISLGDTAAGITAPAAAGGTYQLLSFLPSSAASDTSSQTSSPLTSPSLSSPSNLLPFSLDLSASQSSSTVTTPSSSQPPSAIALAFRRAANTYFVPATFLSSAPSSSSRRSSAGTGVGLPTSVSPLAFNPQPPPASSSSRRSADPSIGSSRRGVLFFLPALLAPLQPSPSPSPNPAAFAVPSRSAFTPPPSASTASRSRAATPSNHAYYPSVSSSLGGDEEATIGLLSSSSTSSSLYDEKKDSTRSGGLGISVVGRKTPPPVYERMDSTATTKSPSTKGMDDEWDEWGQDDDEKTP